MEERNNFRSMANGMHKTPLPSKQEEKLYLEKIMMLKCKYHTCTIHKCIMKTFLRYPQEKLSIIIYVMGKYVFHVSKTTTRVKEQTDFKKIFSHLKIYFLANQIIQGSH